jgi:hypothetical protein
VVGLTPLTEVRAGFLQSTGAMSHLTSNPLHLDSEE